jgi:hypothetical protein
MSGGPTPPVLWGARTGNCLRAVIGLCEGDILFSTRPVALSQGEHRSKSYLAPNPEGKIPVLAGVELYGATNGGNTWQHFSCHLNSFRRPQFACPRWRQWSGIAG